MELTGAELLAGPGLSKDQGGVLRLGEALKPLHEALHHLALGGDRGASLLKGWGDKRGVRAHLTLRKVGHGVHLISLRLSKGHDR